MICPSCRKETPDNSTFCIHCGMYLASSFLSLKGGLEPSSIICPVCKNSNAPSSKYCQKCGATLTVICRRCGSENPLTVDYCRNCGIKLDEATFGIPEGELGKWQEAFAKLGWIENLDPKTKQLLSQIQPPLRIAKEQVMFATFGTAANYIEFVRIDDEIVLNSPFIAAVGTNWRIIFIDTDKMIPYPFPYEDFLSVQRPEARGALKDIRYSLHTKNQHKIEIAIRLDAPGLIGLIAGFSNPITAGQVVSHKRRAQEVIAFMNLYFTRIVP
jgi:ribosomal protein L40E